MKISLTILWMLCLSQIVSCTSIMDARRRAIDEIHTPQNKNENTDLIRYRALVKTKIMRNMVDDVCKKKEKVKLFVKIDSSGSVSSVENKSSNASRECVAGVVAAVNKSSPFPLLLTSDLQRKAVEEGFLIAY